MLSSTRVAACLLSLVALGCSCNAKSPANQETPNKPAETAAADKGLPPAPAGMAKGSGSSAAAPAGTDDRLRLQPDEGKLAIDVPEVKPGAEATATVKVTPGAGYHVNVDYPIKLTLTPPTGVTLAKAELTKGDVNTFDEQHLAFDVKLTAAQSGSYTVNGTFKFAVCTKDQCLPKKETISITVAAK